jgi:uncharacterized protein (DUF2252 family)
VAVLEAQDATREPELVPLRHSRMAASPFTFYRGAAAIMAMDLAAAPSTGLITQLCGDAHLSNFGVFAGPDRRLLFDLNDFDETLPGPFEWDVKRLTASLAIAGRDRGFARSARRRVVHEASRRYRETMHELAAAPMLDVWYARIEAEELLQMQGSRLGRKAVRRARRNLAKAMRKDSTRALSKLTREVEGEPRIVSEPPLIVPLEELLAGEPADMVHRRIEDLFATYQRTLSAELRHLLRRFRYVDTGRKVVGVGSVGTRAWIVLLLGEDHGEPLFLQVKEAQRSVLEPFAKRSAYRNQGRRVVEGQRLMQAAGDVLLGWLRTQGPDGVERDFYVRQLWDGKGSAVIEEMDEDTLATYGELCGATLAMAHGRGGDRAAIAAYLGNGDNFDRAMANFAERYGDQNERDYEAVLAAIESGRLSVAESA